MYLCIYSCKHEHSRKFAYKYICVFIIGTYTHRFFSRNSTLLLLLFHFICVRALSHDICIFMLLYIYIYTYICLYMSALTLHDKLLLLMVCFQTRFMLLCFMYGRVARRKVGNINETSAINSQMVRCLHMCICLCVYVCVSMCVCV